MYIYHSLSPVPLSDLARDIMGPMQLVETHLHVSLRNIAVGI